MNPLIIPAACFVGGMIVGFAVAKKGPQVYDTARDKIGSFLNPAEQD